jgi:hypothetical protein
MLDTYSSGSASILIKYTDYFYPLLTPRGFELRDLEWGSHSLAG